MIEGQLKEKKGGKWKLFKKWKSRYFTLSGAKLSYKDSVSKLYSKVQSTSNDIIHLLDLKNLTISNAFNF